ncbi:uncharacterized protein LTR77_008707 [Saxophila tyrrhenica]|uniref:Zn(2)-C6 fungal-type domain-containing protein n=1 Tax=Saxophila tyrrhenica TaxID=1690608 RepID=A0AAV9P3W6_9PEZI|nr:hypothetical protein LTR77_008707 [Saxophila tyrrhenica]
MPPARKACDRCREHKAKCVWADDSPACLRCQRTKHVCSTPHLDPQRLGQPSTGDADSLTRPAQVREPERRYDSSEALPGEADGSRQQPTDLLEGQNEHDASLDLLSIPSLDARPPFVEGSCASTKCYLPLPEEGERLLQEFLHDFNSRMPLFNPESLTTIFRDCYSGVNDSIPLPWVLVYATMAITHRLRAMSLFATPIDTPQSQWYLEKCLAKLPELLMGPPSLQLVQASLIICFLLQTSRQRQRAALFASTALHMAQELGYNELPASHLADTTLGREQAYVFWISFFMDTNMSLGHRRSTSQRLADISTPIPPANVVNWWDLNNHEQRPSEWNLNVFAQHCSLAVIEAEAAEDLFSVGARKRSPVQHPCEYKDIMSKLERWRANNALAKLEATDVLKAMYRSDIVHSVMLEGAYFRTVCQLKVAKELVGFRSRIDVFAPEALQAMIDRRIVPSYGDSRRFLKLAMLVPQGDVSTTWWVDLLLNKVQD